MSRHERSDINRRIRRRLDNQYRRIGCGQSGHIVDRIPDDPGDASMLSLINEDLECALSAVPVRQWIFGFRRDEKVPATRNPRNLQTLLPTFENAASPGDGK